MDLIHLSDGVRLRTWTTGTPTTKPPVILLHGGPGLWDYLEPVAALLEDLTTVHRFDQRGCGGSDPSEKQSIGQLHQDLEELREYWGFEQFVVIGHSFGATLALTYAAAHPERVAKLGYLAGVGLGEWYTPFDAERLRRMTAEQQDRLAALQTRKRSAAEETELRALSWFTDHADRSNAWAWALEDAAVPFPINFAANRALNAETDSWSADYLAVLAAGLKMPVWLVHGSGDPRTVGPVQDLAEQLPNHELRLIEGVGHSLWRERPDALRQVLKEFLA